MTRSRDALAGLIPVSIITGFLGSGKTTLVNRLLKRPEMNRVAVIVNELGEIGVDNDLVQVSSEQMMLLNNGCLCCVLRGDLQETLRDLFIKRRNGEIIDYDRVVIETTGLADPAPVMQTLLTDSLLRDQYRLDCVVTLVDAVNAPGQLTQFSEPLKQVALADRLIVTKTDLIAEQPLAALTERLREINPRAPLRNATNGEIELAFLVDVGLRRTHADLEEVERWLGADEEHEHGHRHDDERADVHAALRAADVVGGVHAMHGRPDRAAGAGPAASEGAGQRRGKVGADGRAGGPAPVPSPARARCVAERQSQHAARLHHPRHPQAGRC